MKKILYTITLSFISLLCLQPMQTKAQNTSFVNTSAGFLTISPDARAAALGNAGIATSADVNAQHWNAAKYIFVKQQSEASLSYAPWSTKLNDGSFNAYLSGYYKLDPNQAFSASFRWFSYGDEISLTNDNNQKIGSHKPYEMAIDAAYARRLGEFLSTSITFRYIRSDIAKDPSNPSIKVGQAVAADLGVFYNRPVAIFDEQFQLGAGANLSNLGTKISYRDNGNSTFLPTNLGLGGSLAYTFEKNHQLALALDFNKLLVPSPKYNDDGSIDGGQDKSVPAALFSSFGDSPDGFSGEIKEISTSVGAEYTYMQLLSLRCGYFSQSERNGAVQYLSTGAGILYKGITLDVSYLIPTYNKFIHTNEFRFTLGVKIK